MTEAVAERVEVTASPAVQKILDVAKGLSEEDRNALIVKLVDSMTVLNLADLVGVLEKHFGVSASAPAGGFMAMPMGMAGAGAAEPVAKAEPTEFDVVLKEVGDKKIAVIKAVRAVTDLGLKEAKALVDAAPCNVKDKVNKTEAEKIKKELEESGAIIEVKASGS